jgi:tetratricopeptide (TPR) repeat protein
MGLIMSAGPTPVHFIAFAPADNLLAAACGDRTVRLFDAKSGRQTASIVLAESTPLVLTFNADGTILAIGLANGTIQIWDCALAKKLGEVQGWDTFDNELAFTQHSELVAAMNNQTIGVWNRTGTLITTLRGKDWRPRHPDEAARLSGLVLDGFDARPLTLEEEEHLKVDVNVPLENGKLAEYWGAYWTMDRNFAALKNALNNKLDVTASDVDKADSLTPWLKKHAEALEQDAPFRTIVEKARDEHRRDIAKLYGDAGTEALFQGDYPRAVYVFDEVLKIIPISEAPHYRAGRGFARHSKGDEAGAAEDFEAYKESNNVRSWENVLMRGNLMPKQTLIANSFLIWLEPNYASAYGSRAEANFVLKKYDDALADVNEALQLQPASAEPTNLAATPEISLQTASLLLLRGRILDSQGSPDAQKDWQQVAEARSTDEYTRASAQMLLGKFDASQFEAARPFFEELRRKYPKSSFPQYYLGCFFALRAASHGSEGELQRADDLKRAFEALEKGVQLGAPTLRKFMTWATDLQSLDNDPRLKELLSQEEESLAPEATADSQ